jgi:hypothetical protein
MKLPQFLCIGVQKAGTTSLFRILQSHPGIFIPEEKELHFFDDDLEFNKGVSHYHKYFQSASPGDLCGELTPNYIYHPQAPERIIKTLNCDIKLVLMLRNPADRAFSHHKMRIGRGAENENFEDLIDKEIRELKKTEYRLPHHYIDRGFYAEQLKRYLQYFPFENIHIILFEEDFLERREQTIRQLLGFIGADPNYELPINIKSTPSVGAKFKQADKILNTAHPINQLAKRIIPSKKLRADIKYFFTKMNQKANADKAELEAIRPFLINEIFRNDIIKLQELIKRDLSRWLNL